MGSQVLAFLQNHLCPIHYIPYIKLEDERVKNDMKYGVVKFKDMLEDLE